MALEANDGNLFFNYFGCFSLFLNQLLLPFFPSPINIQFLVQHVTHSHISAPSNVYFLFISGFVCRHGPDHGSYGSEIGLQNSDSKVLLHRNWTVSAVG